MALADTLPYRGAAPRILIVRLSALGDIVFATSLLAGLRAAWPQAHIAWLVQAGFAGILHSDPRLDELIRVAADTIKSPAALWRLRAGLKRRAFDWVIDAQGLAKSRLLAAMAPGARVGFDSKEPLGFLLKHRVAKGGDIRDIASEYRYLAQVLSGQPAPPPRLIVAGAARDAAVAALAEHGLRPGYVALCPFTTRPQKHWMEDYWPQLAGLLDGRQLAIFGGPADAQAAARIGSAAPVPVVNLAGKTRLDQLPAYLQQAGVVIGVDTGLTHIGVAVQRPVVALFGSTCPYLQGAESPLTVLYDALACSPCKRHPTCDGRYDCLRGLTPLRVAAAARALLGSAAA
ncbi:MAG: Heptosyltransferase [Hydrocarboniphaga sp.]|uniref:glycosyltransferase family 9 protein n=1 Tax=Hydrocarboniphaga sp. TaxID=2033016 RepID=UPI00261CC7F7|nr:glycosyltransferase family 9 protein [Hydrocarboniphaga sp.]MDB5969474.1 Heptosyltransferase [Hydrocarboniphaga sp.]